MNNCSNHKKEIAGISDMKELATMIGDLHYESLDVLLDNLAVKLHKDGIADLDAGRKKLGVALQNTALFIQKSRSFMQDVLEISKPFMKE